MASKKDFIALEQALAAGMIANTTFTLQNLNTMTPREIVLNTDTNLVSAVADALKSVNPAFDYLQFGEAISQYMKEIQEK